MSAIDGTPPRRSITISEQHGLWRVEDSLGNASLSATLLGALLKQAVAAHKEDALVSSDLTTTANTLMKLIPERGGE